MGLGARLTRRSEASAQPRGIPVVPAASDAASEAALARLTEERAQLARELSALADTRRAWEAERERVTAEVDAAEAERRQALAALAERAAQDKVRSSLWSQC